MKAHPLNKASSKRTPGRRKATFLAKYRPDVFPKEPRTIKTPLHGKISPPCIQNELILARYALHVFKMPCKSPLKDTPSEDLAREGPFSLHGPLKSCTTGESCHARQLPLDELYRTRCLLSCKSCHPPWRLQLGICSLLIVHAHPDPAPTASAGQDLAALDGFR